MLPPLRRKRDHLEEGQLQQLREAAAQDKRQKMQQLSRDDQPDPGGAWRSSSWFPGSPRLMAVEVWVVAL